MEISQLDRISYSILLQETLELRQVLQSIVNSQDTIDNSDIFIPFLPIMSSVCLGWCDLFTKEGIKIEIPDIEGYSCVRLLKNCRIGLKLYCDQRIGKATKQLKKNSEETYRLLKTDYNIFQRLVVSMLGQCDFGVFTINKLPYGNTSQLFLYISDIINFERYKSLGVWEIEARKVVFEFSKLLSQFINTIIDSFAKSNMIDKDSQIELVRFNFSYDDYFLIDEKRRNILRGNLPFEVQLQLFNIVCQNNFITNVLPKILQSSSFLYNRTKIQTYLVSVITINNIINKYPNIKYQKLLKQIIETKEVYFGKGSMFRNNIFHYMIQGIEESVFLNPDLYFNEFVEFYSKTDFNQFMQEISEEIDKINEIIYQLIKFYED
ncbi:MAG: hypothetical protein ACLSFK_05200 [Streptococcus salivarius]|jgi:hypothetical protein|uniref:hypothetical protein n=1 Tax=Streptococcus TaxID=1301 RepID=UPI0032EEC70B